MFLAKEKLELSTESCGKRGQNRLGENPKFHCWDLLK